MKTLLVLSPHPELADTLRQGLSPERYRIVHRTTLEEAEPLLAHGLAGACCLDIELSGVQQTWMIEKIRRCAPQCPLLVFTGARQWEWEEEAYLKGATHVLTKPLRLRMLTTLLDRLWAASAPVALAPDSAAAQLPPALESFKSAEAVPPAAHGSLASPSQMGLRGFSAILTHSLDAEAMLRQFLLLLREMTGLNRAAIFLRSPSHTFGERGAAENTGRLRAACALGLPRSLLDNFELSFDGGIGGLVSRLSRIVRRQSEESRRDGTTQREFELLGAQVAVPILDREGILGVAVFDGHITGEPLSNAELELIFHLLEQVGLAIKNIWLHDQLSGNHELMAGILRELKDACVVVSRDLAVLHFNKAARRFFTVSNARTGELEFSDLPQLIGAKVFQVLKTGTAVPPFRFEPAGAPGTVYHITVVPFQRKEGTLPASVLLMAEDLTHSEQLRQLEGEAANLRLVRTMADRLAHEVGNALVPLSTHQQLLSEKYSDPEFRTSLDAALADGVKRVNRLINQMRFLARDALTSTEAFPLAPLVEEAYEEARKHQPAKKAQFVCADEKKPVVVTGDRAALKHALSEVILNALQANPGEPKIGVFLHADATTNGIHDLQIEVQDNGTGFTQETAQKAPAPFYTTRNIGLGLGLTVSRKIIETHHGKLEILPPRTGQPGVVRISLPVESTPLAHF